MGPETDRALRANDPGFSTDLSTGFVDKGIDLILQIALDTPLRRVFDYRAPVDALATPPPGVRVRVPFGNRELIGVLMGIAPGSSIPASRLRAALRILDDTPVFDPATFELLRWAADYYHHATCTDRSIGRPANKVHAPGYTNVPGTAHLRQSRT